MDISPFVDALIELFEGRERKSEISEILYLKKVLNDDWGVWVDVWI